MAAGLLALKAAESAGLKIMFGLFSEAGIQPWDNTTGYLNVTHALLNDTTSPVRT
jgi:hypothetical protein